MMAITGGRGRLTRRREGKESHHGSYSRCDYRFTKRCTCLVVCSAGREGAQAIVSLRNKHVCLPIPGEWMTSTTLSIHLSQQMTYDVWGLYIMYMQL